MGACQSGGAGPEIENGKPVMTYLPFAGRGEIARLCAAAGGLDIDFKAADMNADRKQLCKTCGCVGTGLPVLQHGTLSMCQSVAIETYICCIAPNFKNLPARIRGIDAMYFAHVEDILAEFSTSGIMGQLFGGPACKKQQLADSVVKWYGHLDSMVPSSGYIGKHAFPTGADCVVLCIFGAAAPWNIFFEQSGVSKTQFPKLVALSERVKTAPEMAAYLKDSATFLTNPFAK